eukprot:TRINITY_DN3833_c0_g1_i1.p1 TRINITY_DN3833_c0_g1~~TRINITY_DN3833_c0_g1_i1.p1  ORF type:complete len:199 (-),score=46.62 TRINITY_DN3833_c0_g1_i1:41-637(-)
MDTKKSDAKPAELEVITGYLLKEHPDRSGILLARWTPRYAVLEEGRFGYWLAKKDADSFAPPRVVINLTQCSVTDEGLVSGHEGQSLRTFTIRNNVTKDVLRLAAENPAEGETWCSALIRAAASPPAQQLARSQQPPASAPVRAQPPPEIERAMPASAPAVAITSVEEDDVLERASRAGLAVLFVFWIANLVLANKAS